MILLLQDRELWTFATLADAVEIEESVYLAGTDGPRRTVQIVIYGRVGEQAEVRWSFRHTPPVARARVQTGPTSRNCRYRSMLVDAAFTCVTAEYTSGLLMC